MKMNGFLEGHTSSSAKIPTFAHRAGLNDTIAFGQSL